MNKRDRVAHAICGSIWHDGAWDEVSARCYAAADAAIAAMPSTRGTRLPEDWEPGARGKIFCSSFGLDYNETLAEFRDYWVAVSGEKGIKRAWEPTWRNWVRRSYKAIPPATVTSQAQLDPGMADLLAAHSIVAGSQLTSKTLNRSAWYEVPGTGRIFVEREFWNKGRGSQPQANGPWPDPVT